MTFKGPLIGLLTAVSYSSVRHVFPLPASLSPLSPSKRLAKASAADGDRHHLHEESSPKLHSKPQELPTGSDPSVYLFSPSTLLVSLIFRPIGERCDVQGYFRGGDYSLLPPFHRW